jgi:hypothetical protein
MAELIQVAVPAGLRLCSDQSHGVGKLTDRGSEL